MKNDLQRFYDLCAVAINVAKTKDREATVTALHEAEAALMAIKKRLTASFEPSGIDCYRVHLQAAAYECLEALGEAPDIAELFSALTAGCTTWAMGRVNPLGSSSLKWRWDVAAIPESYLPKVWPRPHSG